MFGARFFVGKVLVAAVTIVIFANVPLMATPFGALLFYTVTPCRMVDTRNAIGPLGGPALSTGETRTFDLTGICGVPSSARALAVNVTVVQPTGAGELHLLPGNLQTLPDVTTIAFSRGQSRSNNALLRLASDGTGSLKVLDYASGSVHLIIDVDGYFAPPPAIDRIDPAPVPAIDRNYPITVTGSSFVPGSTVYLANVTEGGSLLAVPTTYQSSTQLTATDNFGRFTENWSAQVINPDGAASDIFAFSSWGCNGTPNIGGTIPFPVPPGPQLLTIQGGGFERSASVAIYWITDNGQPVIISPVYKDCLTLEINVNLLLGHTYSMQVTNPDGTSSNPFEFLVGGYLP